MWIAGFAFALLVGQGGGAAMLLPPWHRGGINISSNGCQVSQGITCYKDVVYVGAEASSGGDATVYAVDVSNPTNLQYLARSSYGYWKAYGLIGYEDKLYVANWGELLHIYDICAHNQINPLGVFDVGGDYSWNLSVQGDRVYLAEAHELAESFYIIDVANPASPRLVSATDWAGSPAVAGAYSFYTDGTWFKVLNISDETAPVVASGVDLGVPLGEPVLRGDLAYTTWALGDLNQGTSGLVCVDISDPIAPREVARWATRSFHYYGGLCLLGDLAFLPTGGNGIYAINIAEPTNFFSVAQFEVPGIYALELSVAANGRYVYSGTLEHLPDDDRTGGVQCWQVYTQDPDDAPPGGWKNFSPRQTSWDLQYDGNVLPTEDNPGWLLFEGSAVWASTANGVLHIADTGTASGDKVKWMVRWNATSSRGATVLVRARCKSHNTAGAFIPNLVIEDATYTEEFALLSDRMRARYAAVECPLDGTQWHTYRVTTWSNEFKVYLDEATMPVLSGTRSATTPHARLMMGSGSSPAQQDIEFDYVYAFSSGARGPAEITNDTTPNVRVDVADMPGKSSLSGLATDTARVHWSSDGGLTWESSGGVLWNGRYEGDALPSTSIPAWYPVEGSESLASITSGLLRVLDASTAANTKLKYERLWRASPATGATVLARVRCASAGGDTTYTGNLFLENGAYTESFAILPDRVAARETGLTHFLDGTVFHVYRITMGTAQFQVYVDESPIAVLSGPLVTPTSHNRVMFGSGASAGTQDIYFDYVRYCVTGELQPSQGGPGGSVALGVTPPSCTGTPDHCTLLASAVPFQRYSETANRLRFSIQDVEGNVGWSPVYTLRMALKDTDTDGIDDDWERTWFNSLTPNATSDFDGDGATDGDEFRAGTDPKDATSQFRVVRVQVSNTNTVEICWDAVVGKRYHVQSAPTPAVLWRTVPAGWVVATSNTAAWTGVQPVASQQFYRVQVDF